MSDEADRYDATGSSAKVWDGEAGCYDASRQDDPVYQSCIDKIVALIPESSSLCLDAGCGTGIATVRLAKRCRFVIGADYSTRSLLLLNAKQIGNVTSIQSDIRSLPFRDATFDATVCANTLQHLRPGGPQQQAVAELRRVTKSGGVVAVSVHHYSTAKKRAGWIKEGRPGQTGIDYIFRFSRKDLVNLMPEASISGLGFYGLLKLPVVGGRVQNMAASLLGYLAGRLGYGHMLIAVEKNR